MTCLYSFYPRYVTLKGADKQTIQQNAESITSSNFELRDFLSANGLVFPMPLKEIPFILFKEYSTRVDDILLAFLTPDDGGWVCYYHGKLNLFDTREEMNDGNTFIFSLYNKEKIEIQNKKSNFYKMSTIAIFKEVNAPVPEMERNYISNGQFFISIAIFNLLKTLVPFTQIENGWIEFEMPKYNVIINPDGLSVFLAGPSPKDFLADIKNLNK